MKNIDITKGRFYFDIPNPQIAALIQKALFKIGYKWTDGRTSVLYTHKMKRLFLTQEMRLKCSFAYRDDTSRFRHLPIESFPSLLKHPACQQMKQFTKYKPQFPL